MSLRYDCNMRIGQAQDLPLQGWCRRVSIGATLVVARCVENTAHGHLLETVEHFNFFACDALNTNGFRRDGIPYARQLLDSLLYQSPSQSSQKQQLMTPSLRVPLHAGGTE